MTFVRKNHAVTSELKISRLVTSSISIQLEETQPVLCSGQFSIHLSPKLSTENRLEIHYGP